MKVATETLPQQETWMKPAEFALPEGIIGFPEAKQIELIYNPEELPFMWLRSVDDPGLNFVVVEPAGLVPDYTVEIGDEHARVLEILDPADVFLLNIVTMKPQAPEAATVNLIGPIVVNRRTLEGRQVIITNFADYSARHPLLQSEPAGAAGA